MPAKVVDASALAAVIFSEPEGEKIASRLGEDLLLSPQLLRFEVANICWKKLRKHPDQREALLAAHEMLDRMEIQEIAVPLHPVLLLAEKEHGGPTTKWLAPLGTGTALPPHRPAVLASDACAPPWTSRTTF